MAIFAALVAIGGVWTMRNIGAGRAAPDLISAAHSRAADAALRQNPRDYATADRESLRQLSNSPVQAVAWLRLAYSGVSRNGRVGPQEQTYIDRAYAVGPLDPDISLWRLRFLMNHWGEISPRTRAAAIVEFKTLWKNRRQIYLLRAIPERTSDPAGKLASLMLVSSLEPPRKRSAPKPKPKPSTQAQTAATP